MHNIRRACKAGQMCDHSWLCAHSGMQLTGWNKLVLELIQLICIWDSVEFAREAADILIEECIVSEQIFLACFRF